MWILCDATSTAALDALSPAARAAAHGSLRVVAAGAVDGHPPWESFARQAWPRMQEAGVNRHLPAAWQLPEGFFQGFDVDSTELRDVGAFEYDAVAAVRPPTLADFSITTHHTSWPGRNARHRWGCSRATWRRWARSTSTLGSGSSTWP